MAKFLNTSRITSQLEEIIRGSGGGRLLLISPYLKFNSKIKDLLEYQAQRWKTDTLCTERLNFGPKRPSGWPTTT